jgi:hypothetical protein
MDLVPTQPLTEMSTKNTSGGKGLPEIKTDNPNAICESTADRRGGFESHNIIGLHGILQGYFPSNKTEEHSVAFRTQENYTDWSTAAGRRILMPTFADRGVVSAAKQPRPLI